MTPYPSRTLLQGPVQPLPAKLSLVERILEEDPPLKMESEAPQYVEGLRKARSKVLEYLASGAGADVISHYETFRSDYWTLVSELTRWQALDSGSEEARTIFEEYHALDQSILREEELLRELLKVLCFFHPMMLKVVNHFGKLPTPFLRDYVPHLYSEPPLYTFQGGELQYGHYLFIITNALHSFSLCRELRENRAVWVEVAESLAKVFPFFSSAARPSLVRWVNARLSEVLRDIRVDGENEQLPSGEAPGRVLLGLHRDDLELPRFTEVIELLQREGVEVGLLTVGGEPTVRPEGVSSILPVEESLPKVVEAVKEYSPEALWWIDCREKPRPLFAKLSALRLAPVQIGAFVDPRLEPSGTLDLQVSAAPVESDESSAPALAGFRLSKDGFQIFSQGEVEQLLKTDALRYVSAASPHQLCIETFQVWGRILEQAPDAELLIGITEIGSNEPAYIERIAAVFAAEMKELQIPNQPLFFVLIHDGFRFESLLNETSIYVDPINFSSTVRLAEALDQGCPALTLIRGRDGAKPPQTVFPARRKGAAWVEAFSVDEYVNQAAKLGADESWSRQQRLRLLAEDRRAHRARGIEEVPHLLPILCKSRAFTGCPVGEQSVAFAAVPKTASTYVADYLAYEVFPDSTLFRRAKRYVKHPFQHWTPEDLLKISKGRDLFVSSHEFILSQRKRELLDTYRKNGWFLFTFIRDPKERLCSLYAYMKERTGEESVYHRFSLDQWLRSAASGDGDIPPFWEEFDYIAEYSEENFGRFLKKYFNHAYKPQPPVNRSSNKGYEFYRRSGEISDDTAAILEASLENQRFLEIQRRSEAFLR